MEATKDKPPVGKPTTCHCMMCSHEWEDLVFKGEDKERACPECRSNSVRLLKGKPKTPTVN